MLVPRKSRFFVRLALAGACALAILGLTAPAASAQGLFEALFGALHRARIPPNINAMADPYESMRGQRNRTRDYAGGGPAHCVRTCDGMHFPLQRSAGNPADLCQAFCPGSATKVFYGGSIDYATASDGTHYSDFDNAYVYRDHIVQNCTCNGKDPFGLVALDAKSDPTLRPGDIVATPAGLQAFNGGRNGEGDFTPIAQYGNFPKGYREKLSELKIMPPSLKPKTAASAPATTEQSAQPTRDDRRRVQLSR